MKRICTSLLTVSGVGLRVWGGCYHFFDEFPDGFDLGS